MKVSTKGRYGLRIMVDVAENGAKPVRISDISARQEISVKYAEQITGALVKAKLLKSVRGALGGYELVKPAADYTAGEILRALEGDLVPVDCVNTEYCNRAEACSTRRFWQGLYSKINEYLDSFTLQDLVKEGSSADFYQI